MLDFAPIMPPATRPANAQTGVRPGTSGTSFLPLFTQVSWLVLVLAAFLQCALFPTLANVVGVGYVTVAWSLITLFILRSSVIINYPLSCFFLLSYALSQFYFPLLFTLLEGRKLVFNLELPGELFMHGMLSLIALLSAHGVYRLVAGQRLMKPKPGLKLLNRIGLFDTPTNQQVWSIGFLGLAAASYTYFLDPAQTEAGPVVGSKFIQGFIPFMYAPYFIPLGRLYGQRVPPGQSLVPKLGLFTVLLFTISIVANSRGAFMLGFTSLGFAMGLGMLLNILKIKIFTLRNLIFGALAVWFFTGPVADLGTAMVMVRGTRSEISKPELIEQTWETFQQKDAIEQFKKTTSQGQEWDEYYLDNIFLARFCNLKFNDASLVLAHRIGEHNIDMLNFTIEHTLATLPSPVLNALGFTFDKTQVQSFSYGDYIYYKATSDQEGLGVFRTGHFVGTSLAAFGWWYLLILAVGVIPIFALCDLLFVKVRAVRSGGSGFHYEPTFSLCGLMSLTPIFQLLAYESLEIVVSFPLRNWIQLVLLYTLVFHLARLICALLPMVGFSTTAPLTSSRQSREQLGPFSVPRQPTR